jgi:hypothetical protein
MTSDGNSDPQEEVKNTGNTNMKVNKNRKKYVYIHIY